jgi:hypothetical protein
VFKVSITESTPISGEFRGEPAVVEHFQRFPGLLEFEQEFRYDLDQDGKIKTNHDGTISITWWAQGEDGDWQPWMTNTFRRIADVL